METRKRIVMDGVKIVPQDELHSFIKKPEVAMVGTDRKFPQYRILIPVQIVRLLKVTKETWLLVAIKKATPDDIKEYSVER